MHLYQVIHGFGNTLTSHVVQLDRTDVKLATLVALKAALRAARYSFESKCDGGSNITALFMIGMALTDLNPHSRLRR
jgi:hypothetical protein